MSPSYRTSLQAPEHFCLTRAFVEIILAIVAPRVVSSIILLSFLPHQDKILHRLVRPSKKPSNSVSESSKKTTEFSPSCQKALNKIEVPSKKVCDDVTPPDAPDVTPPSDLFALGAPGYVI